jgi:hypothetical protein
LNTGDIRTGFNVIMADVILRELETWAKERREDRRANRENKGGVSLLISDKNLIVQLSCNFATGSYVKDQMHGMYFAKRCPPKKLSFVS